MIIRIAPLLIITFLYVNISSVLADQPAYKVLRSPWVKYVDKKRGFTFYYPKNSTIDKRIGKSFHIRIQNYKPYENYALYSGHYYLEIFPLESTYSCKKSMVTYKRERAGKEIVLRGIGTDDGDPGGIRFVICAKRNGYVLYVRATENHKDGPIATRILNSFKLSK